jgi:alkyl hydroperoxide reductase subunit F
MEAASMYDVIVIGAGPAGMTAAVYAARRTLKTLILSKDIGGQLLWTAGIEDYMGYQFIEGPELMAKFDEQVKQFPVTQRIGQSAVSLSLADGRFSVITDNDESYQGRTVIIATGKRPRQLNVPGEDRLKGKGVTYCSVCDGPLFAGRSVAVVGGGKSALEAADDMVKIATKVHLVSKSALAADQALIDRLASTANLTVHLQCDMAEIKGSDRVEAVVIRDVNSGEEEELAVGGVLVEVGLIPNTEIARGITELNADDEIEVTCHCETAVPGLFAAGDVTNVPAKHIVVAAGEGAKAALQAKHYLERT